MKDLGVMLRNKMLNRFEYVYSVKKEDRAKIEDAEIIRKKIPSAKREIDGSYSYLDKYLKYINFSKGNEIEEENFIYQKQYEDYYVEEFEEFFKHKIGHKIYKEIFSNNSLLEKLLDDFNNKKFDEKTDIVQYEKIKKLAFYKEKMKEYSYDITLVHCSKALELYNHKDSNIWPNYNRDGVTEYEIWENNPLMFNEWQKNGLRYKYFYKKQGFDKIEKLAKEVSKYITKEEALKKAFIINRFNLKETLEKNNPNAKWNKVYYKTDNYRSEASDLYVDIYPIYAVAYSSISSTELGAIGYNQAIKEGKLIFFDFVNCLEGEIPTGGNFWGSYNKNDGNNQKFPMLTITNAKNSIYYKKHPYLFKEIEKDIKENYENIKKQYTIIENNQKNLKSSKDVILAV